MKKPIKTTSTSILIFLFLLLPFKVFAIAQVIEPILIEDAIRGGEYEKSITVFNTENKEVEINLTATGDVKNWATFFEMEDLKTPIESVIVPPKSNKGAIVKFLIPEDAPSKTYLGRIVASTSPKESGEEGASATLIQEIPREVSIKVISEQVIDCEARILPQSFSLEKNEPLKIKVIYQNKGNVKIKPSIQQKIFKDKNIIFNAIYPYPEDKEEIKPGYPETVPIEWQTAGQEKGEYKAEIKVLLNDKIIKEDNFSFNIGVVKNNTDNPNKFSNFIAGIGGGNITFGYILVGGFFVVLAILIGVIGRKWMFGKFSFKDKKIL